MTDSYVAFDVRTGQILSVHHGATDSIQAREAAQRLTKISEDYVAVITVASDALERGNLYRVDIDSNVLVAAAQEGDPPGVGSSFYATCQTHPVNPQKA